VSAQLAGARADRIGRFAFLRNVARAIHIKAIDLHKTRALLVAISGVDGSGKTHLSIRLAELLRSKNLNVALIHIDAWQNPKTVRLAGAERAQHFYLHCIRFKELFARAVHPLVKARSLDLYTKGMPSDCDEPYDLEYHWQEVDVVLLEGVFLFRRDLVGQYDLRVWIECSFETAADRAVLRNVEHILPAQLTSDYAEIYHAAQRIHFALDAPRNAADIVIDNQLHSENLP